VTAQTQAWIWEHSGAGGVTKLVELALANLGAFGDSDHVALLPSHSTLVHRVASDCGITKNQVHLALLELVVSEEIDLAETATHIACTFTGMQRHLAGRIS
jgi:hypothetical protein